jgi:flagellar secretion chaperone FliS
MPVLAHPARLYQSQAILTTSPGYLVLMLYDGALRFMSQAEEALARPETDRRRIEIIDTTIGRAQAILAELTANLDHDAGGEHAAHLARLYDYYQRRLFEANLTKHAAPLQEVIGLMRILRDGWAEMLRQHPQHALGAA